MTDQASYSVRIEADGLLSISVSGKNVSKSHYIDKYELTDPFGRRIPTFLEDLIDIARAIYSADRLIRRQGEQPRGAWSWQRRLDMQIPVSDPDRWNDSELRGRLADLLGFLTEDRWDFSFYPSNKAGRKPGVQSVLFPPVASVVALFSGGLDSLAGLAIRLATQQDPFAVVACSTNPRIQSRQSELLESIRKQSSVDFQYAPVRHHLKQRGQDYNSNERSQRARGFFFYALGVAYAVMCGASELLVFENGVGAINLRLSDAQLGSQSTRATHPITVKKLELFLRRLLDRDLHIDLPCLFLTKGEMCERLKVSPFSHLATRTISCDSFPQRTVGPEQCGVCSSCLLRRLSLWSGGLHSDDETYRYDVIDGMEKIPSNKLDILWDMLHQSNRFGEALRSSSPWRNLVIQYPELQEVRDVLAASTASPAIDVERRLLELYGRYCSEWEAFPACPPGWSFSSDFSLTA
jgi:7-cyano-7-deazaguanine synthase in queuosine biosynthesis